MPQEIEIKLQLARSGFDAVLRGATVRRTSDQLNVYYDCGKLLATSASTFRIRFSKGRKPMVTLKLAQFQDASGCRESLEIEAEAETALRGAPSAKLARRIITVHNCLTNEFDTVLTALGITRLERIGWVRNRRYEVELAGGSVELDQLSLPNGQTFFEAEIENGDISTRERLATEVQELAPEASPSMKSKFQRFMEALQPKEEAVHATG